MEDSSILLVRIAKLRNQDESITTKSANTSCISSQKILTKDLAETVIKMTK